MKEVVWKTIVCLKQQLKEYEKVINFCAFSIDEDVIFINELPAQSNYPYIWVVFSDESLPTAQKKDLIFEVQDILTFKCRQKGGIKKKHRKALSYYLPFCFLNQQARRLKRAVGISHFAQTLDGRIATLNGNSKWIGSDENLVHAHRMRALSDAILIGYKTLINDQPALTVRRVEGPNPVRVVVGSQIQACDSLLEAGADDQIILIHKKHGALNGDSVKQLILPTRERYFSCQDILKELYKLGINSVYVEGGPKTTSRFLKEKFLDIIQLHIEPLIFGSGLPGFELEPISQVDQAINFSSFYFQKIADTIMFTGKPVYEQ